MGERWATTEDMYQLCLGSLECFCIECPAGQGALSPG